MSQTSNFKHKHSAGFTPLEVKESRGKYKQSKPLTGFTLIELLVVIIIIGILSAIATFGAIKYIDKAKNSEIKAGMVNLMNIGSQYYNTALNSDSDIAGTYTGLTQSSSWYDQTYKLNVIAGDAAHFGCNDPNHCCDPAGCGLELQPSYTRWCACILLKPDSSANSYCVDSSGYAKQSTSDFWSCGKRCSTDGFGGTTPGKCKD